MPEASQVSIKAVNDNEVLKILIVDDIPENIFALKAVLKKLDVEVYEAYSGVEAISLNLLHDFFLILMDVNMPTVDGIEAASIIDKFHNNKTPIIFFTANDKEQENIISAYNAGGVDYLVKPINKDILRNKVSVFLELYKQKRRIELEKNEYEHLASYDSLTGLMNRFRFEEMLEKTLYNVKRHGFEAALLYIDLDNFKHVNDNYGHFVGDLILQKAANIFKSSTRHSDTIARLGGDEFIIILDVVKSRQAVKSVAEKLLSKLMQQHNLDKYMLSIHASIGIVYCDQQSLLDDPAKLIDAADKAMYQAKKSGGGQCFFLDSL